MTHICVGNLTIIGSNNSLSPGRRQSIIRTNAGILLIGTIGTNFSEILIEMHIFSFKKMHLKISSGKWWPFCFGLNALSNMLSPVNHVTTMLNQYYSRSFINDTAKLSTGVQGVGRRSGCCETPFIISCVR